MRQPTCKRRGATLFAAIVGLATLSGCAPTNDVGDFLRDFARQVLAAWIL